MTALPPLYDEHGDVRPPTHPDEQYLDLARRLAEGLAGGWAPESVPGKQAMAEFEAFVRETQARAVDAFERQYGGPTPMSAQAWAQEVRAGRTDLDGRRRA